MQKYLDQKTFFDRWDAKEAIVRRRAKLSRRRTDVEDVGEIVRASASDRGETDRGELVLNWRIGRKPVQGFQEWCNMIISW